MSHHTLEGVICPKSNPSPKALEKRVRRSLAHVGAVLSIHRPGTLAHQARGGCSVTILRTGETLFVAMNLTQIAEAVGALDAAETVMPWTVFVTRQIDNVPMVVHESGPLASEVEAITLAQKIKIDAKPDERISIFRDLVGGSHDAR